jgi:syringate O-demethylase
MVSLAMVDNDQSAPGTEVTLVWGEPGRGSTKPTVERHKQIELRAVVAPVPISEVARVAYRPK